MSLTHDLLGVLSMATWWNLGHELKKIVSGIWSIASGTQSEDFSKIFEVTFDSLFCRCLDYALFQMRQRRPFRGGMPRKYNTT